MDGYILEKKSFFKMLELTFSSKLDWYSKKSGALIRFFLLRLLCIFINLPYNHVWNIVVTYVWADAPSFYLDLLDKLQEQICRTVGLSLGCFLLW